MLNVDNQQNSWFQGMLSTITRTSMEIHLRNFSKRPESQSIVYYKYQTNIRGTLVAAAQQCPTE